MPDTKPAQEFLKRLLSWAGERDDIRAIVVVGSFARGEARPDSDLDVVLLVNDPQTYVAHTDWVMTFGPTARTAVEFYGKVTSIRAFYDDGLEAEFAIATADWATSPLDAGTEEVVSKGMTVLMDRDGQATALEKEMRRRTRPSS